MNRWRYIPWEILGRLRPVSDVIAVAIGLSASLLLSACASPVEGLWPPSPDSAARTLYVSLNPWHAMIAFPLHEQAVSRQPSFEEWGYAERAWYLKGRTGVTGILRALFWPTEGVVEVGRYDLVWAKRTAQPPFELFVFRVSEEGYRRLQSHLRSTIASVEPVTTIGGATFYPAVRSYHLFHTCHQYAAHALREAGLPISAHWAFNRASLAWQLRRAARIAAEQAPVSLSSR